MFSILISDQLISWVMEKLYQKTYTGQTGGTINNLLQNYDHVPLLAMGNSRCAHHVIPQQLNENAFNLSHNGMSLVFHTGLIDQLISNEKIKIDTILLHLERDEIIGKDYSLKQDIQHLKYYYNKNEWIRERINGLSYFEPLKYSLASYKWNGKVMNIINNRIKSDMNKIPHNGYVFVLPGDRDSVNVTWSYDRRIANNITYSGDTINIDFKKNIEHLVALCKEKNVTLVLFTSPIYHPAPGFEKMDLMLQDYFKSEGAIYINYFNAFASDERFATYHLWKDAQHLNHEGAKIFTDVLRSDLNKLHSQNEH